MPMGPQRVRRTHFLGRPDGHESAPVRRLGGRTLCAVADTKTPIGEPKTVHIWMPDGRSLCDRRARPARDDWFAMSDAEFEHQVNEQVNAPACGCCLVLAHKLIVKAAVLYEEKTHYVYPAEPTDACAAMTETRWAHQLSDLAEAIPKFKYSDLGGELKRDSLIQAADYMRDQHRAQWEDLTTARAEELTGEPTDEPDEPDEP
jgi:hypothetical protein